MESKTLYNSNGEKTMQKIKIELHGSGGARGIKCIQKLTALLEMLKEKETPQEVEEQFNICMGYCLCCIDCGYIDENGADELMQIASVLCAIEMERAEKGTREHERTGKEEIKRNH